MYLLRLILKEILNEKWKTILMISLSGFMAVIFIIAMKSMDNMEQSLENVYRTSEVRMVIHRSDKKENLNLEPDSMAELEQCGYFKESIYSSAFNYYNYQWNTGQIYTIRDNMEADTYLLQLDAFWPAIQCIIGDQGKNLSYGECITGIYSPAMQENGSFTIYQGPLSEPIGERDKNPGIPLHLSIIGKVNGNNLYINYDQYLDICKSLNIPVTIYSAEFIIKDTKRLDILYDYLRGERIFRSSSGGETSVYTYQILDGILRENTELLIIKIKIQKTIIYILLLISGCIGAFLTYLSVRFGKKELFLMKSTGMPVMSRFLSIFLKQACFCLIGSLAGLFFLPPEYIFKYLICYMTGSILSVLRFLFMKSYRFGMVKI